MSNQDSQEEHEVVNDICQKCGKEKQYIKFGSICRKGMGIL